MPSVQAHFFGQMKFVYFSPPSLYGPSAVVPKAKNNAWGQALIRAPSHILPETRVYVRKAGLLKGGEKKKTNVLVSIRAHKFACSVVPDMDVVCAVFEKSSH